MKTQHGQHEPFGSYNNLATSNAQLETRNRNIPHVGIISCLPVSLICTMRTVRPVDWTIICFGYWLLTMVLIFQCVRFIVWWMLFNNNIDEAFCCLVWFAREKVYEMLFVCLIHLTTVLCKISPKYRYGVEDLAVSRHILHFVLLLGNMK